MPFFEYPSDLPLLRTFEGPKAVPIDTDVPDEHKWGQPTGFSTLLGAQFEKENTIGSLLASESLGVDQGKIEPDYNVFDDIEGYEDYVDRFEDVYNSTAANAIKSDIDREERNNQIIAASGWVSALSTGLLAAGIDLPTLIPAGAAVRGAHLGVKAGRMAAQVGLMSGVAAGAAELSLQETQKTRTGLESGMAIGGSVILGGLLGYAGGRLITRSDFNQLAKIIDEKIAGNDVIDQPVANAIFGHLASGGSAETIKPTLEAMGISGVMAGKLAGLTAKLAINPGVQSMVSDSVAMRRVFNQLAENPIATKMNEAGETIGSAVETELTLIQRGALSLGLRGGRKIYKDMRKAGIKMTRSEFYEAVGRAARRGDVGDNEFVSEAASHWRKTLFDRLKDEGVEIGIWPKDIHPTTALSYLTRLYNHDRLVAFEPEFKNIISNWAQGELGRLSKADLDAFTRTGETVEDHARAIADSVFDNLTGRGSSDVPDFVVPLKRGPLQERVLTIDDVKIEDFLENNIELVGRYYARTAGAEITLARKFGRADMRDQIKEIRDDYLDLRKNTTDPKELKKLTAGEKRDITNIQAFRDMIRGTYMRSRDSSAWGRATRVALGWNFMRLLGGVTTASIPDVSRVIAFRGITPIFSELLPALASNVKGLKLSVKEGKIAGAVTETIMNTRLATLAELSDPMRGQGSLFEKMMDASTQGFARLTGITFWNDFMKGTTSVLAQNRIIDNVFNWPNLNKQELLYMGSVGIDETMAKKIAKQVKTHGEKSKTIWVANTDKWGAEGIPVGPTPVRPDALRMRTKREVTADIQRMEQEQAVRQVRMDDPKRMADYAKSKGISTESMDKLTRDNHKNAIPVLENFKKELAGAAENPDTSGIKFRDLSPTEPGAEGRPQGLLEGVKPVTDADRIALEAGRTLTGGNKPLDVGLFGAARDQLDIADMEIPLTERVEGGERVVETSTVRKILDDLEEDQEFFEQLKLCDRPGNVT